MCGIVGVISNPYNANKAGVPTLLEGLHRLEYRGYDSAGIAIIDDSQQLNRRRSVGKIAELEGKLTDNPLAGHIGIAHTRWATHGPPTEINAHPHIAADNIALVCNGIIENYDELRIEQQARGIFCESQTDTEVLVKQIHLHMLDGMNLIAAVKTTIGELQGAFAIGILCAAEPHRLIGARRGSPLVVGLGDTASYLASDMAA